MDKIQSPSFKSKINFIPYGQFAKMNKINPIKFDHEHPNVLKADKFWSANIRSCTGGGIVGKNEASGYHIWDDRVNFDGIKNVIENITSSVKEPVSGLVIGAKDIKEAPRSMPMFTKIRNAMNRNVPNVSVFQAIKEKLGQIHYAYNRKEDTWYLCCEKVNPKNGNSIPVVRGIKSLKNFFSKISIAPNDRLFIKGKEVLPKDCPEIFK